MAKAKLAILYGEGDGDVVAELATAFQKAGYSVQEAIGRKSAEEALKKSKFDLVVLGSSMSRNDRHHLPYMVKKASSTSRVLVMHTDGSRHPYVDANTDTGEDMEHLVKKIASLQQPKTMAAGAGR